MRLANAMIVARIKATYGTRITTPLEGYRL